MKSKEQKTPKKKTMALIVQILLIVVLVAALLFGTLNLIVCLSAKTRMRSIEDSLNDKGYDCIIVLGWAYGATRLRRFFRTGWTPQSGSTRPAFRRNYL